MIAKKLAYHIAFHSLKSMQYDPECLEVEPRMYYKTCLVNRPVTTEAFYCHFSADYHHRWPLTPVKQNLVDSTYSQYFRLGAKET